MSQTTITVSGDAPYDVVIGRALLGEVAGGERKPGDEADAVRLAIVQHVFALAAGDGTARGRCLGGAGGGRGAATPASGGAGAGRCDGWA